MADSKVPMMNPDSQWLTEFIRLVNDKIQVVKIEWIDVDGDMHMRIRPMTSKE